MKKCILLSMILLCGLTSVSQVKILDTPDINRGLPVMKALSERKSVREYSDRDLTSQDLSDLLWAATGKNRENGNLTAPSCRNFQEIHLYVFDKEGIWEYLPAAHALRPVTTGDHRKLVADKQDFVMDAPVSLVMIADMQKFGNHDQRSLMMAAVDAGIVSENISLACAGLGLATVPRASMDVEGIKNLLNLGEDMIPIMNNPVGYTE